MGLATLPSPSEGVICIFLVNTAISISIVKGLLRSILAIFGIRLPPPSSDSPGFSGFSEDSIGSSVQYLSPPQSYVQEFWSRNPTTQYKMVHGYETPECSCSVCLTQFEPESEINNLSCGHLFHKLCLEKWMDYWNITCPLCRTPLISVEDETSCYW